MGKWEMRNGKQGMGNAMVTCTGFLGYYDTSDKM